MKRSSPRKHRYIAMSEGGRLCGHQHHTASAALHCGGNCYAVILSAKDKQGNREVSFERVAG